MHVLIADKLSESAVEALQSAGMTVRVEPDLTADQLPENLQGIHALVVRSTRVTAEAISAASDLSIIVRAGAGVNTIDVGTASREGVYVTNCPGRNAAAVAELAIGLLIACDRRLALATIDLREGRWKKREYGRSAGLRGRTLGILGMGQIGQAVARRARGMEMQVLAWSRSLTREQAEAWDVRFAETPLSVAKEADAVSLHLAAAPETEGLVGDEFLQAMKPGATLVNTSRGEIIPREALVRAIESKQLRVGLDVYPDEPKGGDAAFDDQELLRTLVVATPHIGASTDEASEAIAAEVVRILRVFRGTGQPPNTVNMCARSPATHSLVVRHFNRVGVLASVLDLLREEGINVEEMKNTIFDGAEAACCNLQLDEAPSDATVRALQQNPDILQAHLESRVEA